MTVSYIEKRPAAATVCAAPAVKLPAHPTAVGRVLLAFSPAAAVDMRIHRGLRSYSAHTVTEPDRFRRAIKVTRLARVAATRWEFEDGLWFGDAHVRTRRRTARSLPNAARPSNVIVWGASVRVVRASRSRMVGGGQCQHRPPQC